MECKSYPNDISDDKWAFRRLARDYERLPATLAGFLFLAFVILLLKRVVEMMMQSA
jgi:hypothetical protein